EVRPMPPQPHIHWHEALQAARPRCGTETAALLEVSIPGRSIAPPSRGLRLAAANSLIVLQHGLKPAQPRVAPPPAGLVAEPYSARECAAARLRNASDLRPPLEPLRCGGRRVERPPLVGSPPAAQLTADQRAAAPLAAPQTAPCGPRAPDPAVLLPAVLHQAPPVAPSVPAGRLFTVPSRGSGNLQM